MRRRELLAVLFPLLSALLVWPLLQLANRPAAPGGVPALVLYLFSVWAAIVVLLLWAARRPGDEDGP